MLIAAFVVLGTAVLLGSALAILRVRTDGAAAPPWWFAGLHGIFAIAGLGCLLLALRGPPRGLATGTASFGLMAAVLIVLAALVGGGTPCDASPQEATLGGGDRRPRHACGERLRHSCCLPLCGIGGSKQSQYFCELPTEVQIMGGRANCRRFRASDFAPTTGAPGTAWARNGHAIEAKGLKQFELDSTKLIENPTISAAVRSSADRS